MLLTNCRKTINEQCKQAVDVCLFSPYRLHTRTYGKATKSNIASLQCLCYFAILPVFLKKGTSRLVKQAMKFLTHAFGLVEGPIQI